MTKPQEFREQRTIREETQYQVTEEATKGPQASKGVLTPGRVVWLAPQAKDASATVTAFAEGIGVVSVAAQSVGA